MSAKVSAMVGTIQAHCKEGDWLTTCFRAVWLKNYISSYCDSEWLRQVVSSNDCEPNSSNLMGGSSSGKDNAGDSSLAKLLLERWAWGTINLPFLQRVAAAAVEDGLDKPLLRLGTGEGFGDSNVLLVHFWYTFGTFLVHFWCSFGALLVHFWCICGAFLVHFWCIVGTLLVYFWCIFGAFWFLFGFNLGQFWVLGTWGSQGNWQKSDQLVNTQTTCTETC